jgi:hypothetical protein
LHYELAGGGGYRRANGVWVLPGEYTVVLTVEGKSYRQPLTVRMDPRVKTLPADLQRQFADSQRAASALKGVQEAVAKGTAIEEQLVKAPGSLELQDFQRKLSGVLGKPDPEYGAVSRPVDTDTTSLRHLQGKLRMVLYALQSADVAPTPEQEDALRKYEATTQSTEQQWNTLLSVDLPKLNGVLRTAGAQKISSSESVPIEEDLGNDRDQ